MLYNYLTSFTLKVEQKIVEYISKLMHKSSFISNGKALSGPMPAVIHVKLVAIEQIIRFISANKQVYT
jgi:uncharacterized protein YoaH (UPF0181 family)